MALYTLSSEVRLLANRLPTAVRFEVLAGWGMSEEAGRGRVPASSVEYGIWRVGEWSEDSELACRTQINVSLGRIFLSEVHDVVQRDAGDLHSMRTLRLETRRSEVYLG